MRFRTAAVLAVLALMLGCGDDEPEVVIVKKKIKPDYAKQYKENVALAKKRDAEHKRREDLAPTLAIGQSATVGKIQFTPLSIELRRVQFPKRMGLGMADMAASKYLVLTCEFKNTSMSEKKIKPLSVTLNKCEVVDNLKNRLSEIKVFDLPCIEKDRKSEDAGVLGQEKMTTLIICQAPTSAEATSFLWWVYFSKDVENDVGIAKVKFTRADIRVVKDQPATEKGE